MRLEKGLEMQVFPEFIPVPQLHVVKSILIVLFEGVEIDVPVFREVVCEAVVPPVAIAEKDEFRGVVERDYLRLRIGPV
jgi:hypothetical protein